MCLRHDGRLWLYERVLKTKMQVQLLKKSFLGGVDCWQDYDSVVGKLSYSWKLLSKMKPIGGVDAVVAPQTSDYELVVDREGA